MVRTVSLQGGMAGGKTTLAKLLEDQLRDVTFIYENPYPLVQKRNKMQLNLHQKEDFLLNQKLFIDSEDDRFNQFSRNKVIYDRGIEDIEFYSLHFPLSIDKDWNRKRITYRA